MSEPRPKLTVHEALELLRLSAAAQGSAMRERASPRLDTAAEAGDLRPAVADTLPLTNIDQAHRRLERGGVEGKIVLTVTD